MPSTSPESVNSPSFPRVVSPRNAFLDLVKGVLIFLVVYGHSIQFAGYSPAGIDETARHFTDPVYKAVYSFHMALFIAISGYFACGSIRKRSFLEFNRTRFIQIVIPLLAWSLSFHASTIVMGMLKSRDLSVGLARVGSLSLFQIGAEFWFLWAVFLGGLIVSAAQGLGRYKFLAFIAAFALLLLCPDNEIWNMIKFTFPFFIAGYFVSESGIQWRIPGFAFVAALVASAIVWHYWNHDTFAYTSGMRWQGNSFNLFLRYAGGITGSIVVLEILWRVSQNWRPALVTRWGRETLAIYVIQTYLFIPMTGIAHPLRDWSFFSITAAPVLSVAICCLGVVAAAVLRKNKWLAFFYLGVPVGKKEKSRSGKVGSGPTP